MAQHNQSAITKAYSWLWSGLTKIVHILLDTYDKMGCAYGSKATPHMFVINPEDVVMYAGVLDTAVIANSTNYVAAAAQDKAMSGR